jgi:hypothetical protein
MGFLLKYYYDILLFNTKYLYHILRNCLCQSILFPLSSTTVGGDRYYWYRVTSHPLDVSFVLNLHGNYARRYGMVMPLTIHRIIVHCHPRA